MFAFIDEAVDHTQFLLLNGTRPMTGSFTAYDGVDAIKSGAFRLGFQSGVADGASAVGFSFNTTVDLANTSAVNFRIRNAGTDLFAVSKNRTKLTNQTIWADGVTGTTPTSGTGTRMMWIPDKAAFRAGLVTAGDSAAWDAANIGLGSSVFGSGCRGSGNYTLVAGINNSATQPNTMVVGTGNSSTGASSLYSGSTNSGSASQSIVTGNSNAVSGTQQAVFGANNSLLGGSANVVGGTLQTLGTAASGNGVFGVLNTVGPSGSSAIYNLIGGFFNNAQGTANLVGGQSNTVAGSFNLVSGQSINISSGPIGGVYLGTSVVSTGVVQGGVAIGKFLNSVHNTATLIGSGLSAGAPLASTATDQILMGIGAATPRLHINATGIGFHNTAPVGKSAAYTPSNVTADRTYDANSTSVNELADVLGTLIADLQLTGLIG